MESWVGLVFVVAIIAAIILVIRYEQRIQDRIQKANELGRRVGYFQGWMAHAKGIPLNSMPPILYEIEEVLRQRHGWAGWKDSLYGYLGTDELDEIETLGDVTLEEWQASKLREINDEYLGSNR